jgi:hypothetical protein
MTKYGGSKGKQRAKAAKGGRQWEKDHRPSCCESSWELPSLED